MRWDSKNTKRTNGRLDGRTDVKKYFLMSGILKKKIPRAPDLGASFFFSLFFVVERFGCYHDPCDPHHPPIQKKKRDLRAYVYGPLDWWERERKESAVAFLLSYFVVIIRWGVGCWGSRLFPRQYWIIRQGGITTTMEDLSTSPCCFSSRRWLSNRYSARLFLFFSWMRLSNFSRSGGR